MRNVKICIYIVFQKIVPNEIKQVASSLLYEFLYATSDTAKKPTVSTD